MSAKALERTNDGGERPTIRDVALRAGVSVATASNVVNGNRPVGEASRRRVVEAIAALGYRLDRSASALRGKSTRLVGMVVPDITNVFFASLVHGVEALAEAMAMIFSSSLRAKTRRRSAAASRRWSRAASTASLSSRRATTRWRRSRAKPTPPACRRRC